MVDVNRPLPAINENEKVDQEAELKKFVNHINEMDAPIKQSIEEFQKLDEEINATKEKLFKLTQDKCAALEKAIKQYDASLSHRNAFVSNAISRPAQQAKK
jgi:peptidoglycan hydrolase CwlO-like protein